MVSHMLALDTTALAARITWPPFSTTPAARPPSIRMRSTCDLSRTLPPFFFTPLRRTRFRSRITLCFLRHNITRHPHFQCFLICCSEHLLSFDASA